MNTLDNDLQMIHAVIKCYFLGTYHGDATQLRTAYHPDAHITGIFHQQLCDWSLDEFLTRVTTKPTAAEKGETYAKEIICIDHTGDAAMVKAQVKVGQDTFIDYITLLKINGKWLIRNKSFTTVSN